MSDQPLRGNDPASHDTRMWDVIPATIRRDGQTAGGTQGHGAVPANLLLLSNIYELGYKRRVYMKEVFALDNRSASMIRRACGFKITLPEAERTKICKRAAKIIAAVRDGTKLSGEDQRIADDLAIDIHNFDASAEPLRQKIAWLEKEMGKLAQQHPLWGFVQTVKGIGTVKLAILLAEARDEIATYKSPAALWKRLGLAVIDGVRQQRRSGKEEAAAHGYNPKRRSEIWIMEDPLLRQQWRKNAGPIGPYGIVYGHAKAAAIPRVEATRDLPYGDPDKWTGKRVEAHARRLMIKAFIADLWRVAHGLSPREYQGPSAQRHPVLGRP